MIEDPIVTEKALQTTEAVLLAMQSQQLKHLVPRSHIFQAYFSLSQ
jgi:hypothetical protein